MKRNVILEIPFKSGKFASIRLPEPCIYCGKPVNDGGFTWTGSQIFNLKKWGISRKFGDHQVYDLQTNGQIQKGTVKVEVPYCAEHKEGIKTFQIIRTILIVLGLVAGAVSIVLYWPNRLGNLLDLVAIGFLLLVGFAIGLFLSIFVNKIISLLLGKKSDYPAMMEGHWGFTVETVTVDKGELGVGPITYYLQVVFLNPDSAQRTLAAFPGTRVLKGQDLLSV